MATGLVASRVPLSLTGGRPAAPGEEVPNLDLDAEQAHIESGAIVVCAATPGPPGPPPTPSGVPKRNASREAWATYAVELGVVFPADATRDEIRTAVDAAASSTPPQKD
jgi:hypothetical protein